MAEKEKKDRMKCIWYVHLREERKQNRSLQKREKERNNTNMELCFIKSIDDTSKCNKLLYQS